MSNMRAEEQERLQRLVGCSIVAVQENEDGSPSLILERNGELFHEVFELSKFHTFKGPNVESFYAVEELSKLPAWLAANRAAARAIESWEEDPYYS